MSSEELQQGLRELAAELGEPPPELEAKLRARYRARRPRRAAWAWAVAAVLALGIALGAWLGRQEPQPEPVAKAQPNDFLLLDYGRPTQQITAGRLVRVTLPPTAPEWFGIAVDPRAQDGIEAEVLLGDDGVAQAVRFID